MPSASTPTPAGANSPPTLVYVGSSTVANFLREAEPVYRRVRLTLDTLPESVGGERAIQEKEVDLAGVAFEPSDETLALGVRAELIGTDVIAVAVNESNPVSDLSLEQLKGIFTGKIRSWKEAGGPDLPVHPFVVAEESATRHVFRALVLDGEDFAGCEVVRPDSNLPMMVEAEPGGIGAISHSFLCSGGVVRVVRVGGEPALPDNEKYPISRPLYLLWRPGNPEVEALITWTRTPAAAEVLAKCFGKRRS
jgi:phosphate transport system substrate-binding protein